MKRWLPWIALLLGGAAEARPWSSEVMYFVMTDRFHDGDPANNEPQGSAGGLYDPQQENPHRYHGGDLRGLELAVRSGYFTELGVSALWITPPLKNGWRTGYGGGWSTGYHGYWTQDFLDIDPHLTSAISIDGRIYPEGAEGRMEHYRDFVRGAQAAGLRVIQDAVINHAGTMFYYDVNGNGVFDVEEAEEWMQPYRADGIHDNARWAELPEWNLRRTGPAGPRRLLGRTVPTRGVLADLSIYGRRGFSSGSLGKTDGEEVMCDFFTLRDFWTEPGSAHFDRLVDELVEIHAFYLLDVGVDGLRIDTVKHVHHEFLDAFLERLRERLGGRAAEKLIFGEAYDDNPAKVGQYTWRADAAENPAPGLDSMLNFPLCFAMRDYLRHEGQAFGNARRIGEAMAALTEGKDDSGRAWFNPHPGADGLNSIRKSVTFVENHDGLNRFRVAGVGVRRNELAQALVMSLPGIPCLYYGTEAALQDTRGKVGLGGESGRMSLWKTGDRPAMEKARELPSFRVIAELAAVRKEHPALREGDYLTLWVDAAEDADDDGVFAFARVMADPAESVVVVFNLSPEAAVTGKLELNRVFPEGSELRGRLLAGEGETGEADGRIKVPAESAVIYSAAGAG